MWITVGHVSRIASQLKVLEDPADVSYMSYLTLTQQGGEMTPSAVKITCRKSPSKQCPGFSNMASPCRHVIATVTDNRKWQ